MIAVIMLTLVKKAFSWVDNYLCRSRFIQRVVLYQYRRAPLPLAVFDYLFRSALRRRLFNFYAFHIFHDSYTKRDGDQLGYWLSKESLYWHFWRQTDIDQTALDEVVSLAPVHQSLHNKELIAVEIGFGIGKGYASRLKDNTLKKYIAVEPNAYLCTHMQKKFKSEQNFEVVCATADEFIAQDRGGVDILLCANGVFMYMDPDSVDAFFQSLCAKGVQFILILNEGTPSADIHREDGTVMYNFKERLLASGYADKHFIEKRRPDGLYRYFLMY
ncbi:MAG TPA: hypothetical protein DCZ84_00920 [Candidatus Vogelbacteria bacterium]|uniref:Methyltransferase domain-containing protein n=1 Tax=Candidatus Vogelbacteria bacterium RIFOXYD1_FULL_51_18 TaxID=1802440 RepID=A0A1G2QJ44_9BACT|nr:MAG: hypothetical protein A2569_00960 [Candidatus Vogelbacteria bacterium RIFOXYD1_FULL_51_18]HBB65187.1 hypothetical protein [Candidatus Vogelbacteria bacterium]HBC44170.1 hypothetical protein [Candidatus Vogelbacteria bacterium]